MTGAAVAVAGIALTIAGTTGEVPAVTGLGAVATLTGVVVLGPVAARPAAAVLGAPLAARRGMSGVLARRNAMRNPRRTAGTAVSLMIGEGRGGLSTDLAAAVAELPEVAAASPIGGAPVRIDGRDTLASTFDPATIGSVVDLGVRDGSIRDLGPDHVAISVDYAQEHGLALGDPLTVELPDGATERATVGAVYANDNLITSGGIVLPRDAFLPHTSRPVDVNMLINLADGVPEAEGEAAVQRVADRFGAPDAQTNQEFTDSIAGEINVLLTVVYALLVIAILIALMGIATTLSLSIHERTRELGLLRAVGQTEHQTRAMVRGEALIVALFGTAGGLGLFLGWATVSALAIDGFTSTFAVPTVGLAVTLALGAVAGVLAAVRPARRAARMDVLAAIATE